MTNMIGADADELDRVGVIIEQSGRRIAASGKRLGVAMNASPWHGGNAERFRQEFQSVHAKAMAEAAAFLDEAYETLRRNATEQRNASESGPRSMWTDLINQIRHFPGVFPHWLPPFGRGRFPRLPWWGIGRPGRWRFPLVPPAQLPGYPFHPPRIPFGPWHFVPQDPGRFLPDLRPFDPIDWIDDVIIGGGVAGIAGIGGWITGILGGGQPTSPTAPSNPTPTLPGGHPTAPVTPTPPATPPTNSSAPDGPYNVPNSRIVEIAQSQVGQWQNPLGPDGTAWNGKGQCIAWVDRWLESAGIKNGLPGGTSPFEQLEQMHGVRVDRPMPGDVFQRAIPGSWNGSVHTAIVKSYDPATDTVVLIEGNVTPGKVTESLPTTIKALGRADRTEVRFYRLGQV